MKLKNIKSINYMNKIRKITSVLLCMLTKTLAVIIIPGNIFEFTEKIICGHDKSITMENYACENCTIKLSSVPLSSVPDYVDLVITLNDTNMTNCEIINIGIAHNELEYLQKNQPQLVYINHLQDKTENGEKSWIILIIVFLLMCCGMQMPNCSKLKTRIELHSKLNKMYDIQKYSEENLTNSNCTVCMEDYNHNENTCVLKNCKHVFHKGCIDKWIQTKQICPNCNGQLIM